MNSDIKVLNINENAKNGQYKCSNCGSTEIFFDEKTKSLRCKHCGTVHIETT